jgi:hypothetical protein
MAPCLIATFSTCWHLRFFDDGNLGENFLYPAFVIDKVRPKVDAAERLPAPSTFFFSSLILKFWQPYGMEVER